MRTSILAGLLPVMLAAQAPYKPPHGPDGHPNFNGIWQAMNTANWDLEDHNAQAGLVLALGAEGAEPGGLSVVEGGKIPYLPEALEKRKQNYQNRLKLDPEIYCYLPGVPRATYMPYPFQIFQSAKGIAIAYEYDGAFRNIFLKDPGPAPIDTWMGQSVGHWEGDTLVVDVTGLDERTWFDRSGNYHSDQLHVVERYTLHSPDVLWYEATIEDPKVFSRPWKISMPLYRHVEKNAQLMDFKCVEFVEELIYGQYSKKPTK
ncbi:MAG TPA: hypothetical protein VKX39_03605 [Bryobacteraceae bacterium]|jgi:hypothetical protein|nr:hypothetical protein [Bryobacteraceae bacterium]